MVAKIAKNIAVIFAGGIGARMGYKNGPKQFMKADEKPILVYTLDVFQNHNDIDLIYLAVVSTHIEFTRKLIDKYGLSKVVRVVSGGHSAIESIQNILQAIIDDNYDDQSLVIIHDGVRPIVSKQLITNCICLTKITGNAIACIPATETVCKSLDGVVVDSMEDRSQMYILQAPQCFILKDIYKINMEAVSSNINHKFVDQASIAKFFNYKINLTPGLRNNIKITTMSDYEYFVYLVNSKKYYKILEGEF